MTDLPATWSLLTLNDVASWGSGGTPKATVPAFYGGSILWAVIGDLNDGVVTATAATISESGLGGSAAKLVKAGTILVAMYGSIGKLGIAGVEMATNQAIAFATPDESQIDPKFLFWYLLQQRPVLQRAGKGATQRNISQTILKAWPIPVPPLDEQRRIVSVIEEQLSRIEAAEIALRDVHAKLTSHRVAALIEVFEAGWRRGVLADVADTQLGKMLSAKSKRGVNPTPYVRNRNVRWDLVDISDVAEMDFTEGEIDKFRLEFGDVLICEGGAGVGRTAIWRDELELCCYQKALHRVRPGPELLPEFLMHFMRYTVDSKQLTRHLSGVAIGHFPQEDLRALELPLPSREQQLSLVAKLDAYSTRARALEAELESASMKLRALRAAILRDAFSGRLLEASVV